MTIAQANTARRLVEARGRPVTFLKLSRVNDNAQKPWRGTADARSIPEATAIVPMVTVPPSSASALGLSTMSEDLVKRTDQIGIVAPGGDSADDLAEFDVVIDSDNTEWKTDFIETLAPAGNVRIVYFVGLRR